MFIQFPNLPPGNCLPGRSLFARVHHVYTIFKLTSRGLFAIVEARFQNYLKVTPGD